MRKRFNIFWTVIFSMFFSFESLQAQKSYYETGIASFYADKFEGRKTANGEIYYHAKKTAAHRKLPFGSILKVTNIENNKYVIVRINDRGPFIDNRVIDLSKSAAKELGFVEKGLAKVKIELIASTDDLPDKKPGTSLKKRLEGYYKIDVSFKNPTGKGIQAGSFREDENIFKIAEELKSKYKTDVYIQIVKIKNAKVYRVIVGSSMDEIYLKKLKELISKDYPDCFVVTFKNY